MRYKKDKKCIFVVFWCIFTLHIFVNLTISFHTISILFASNKLIDALNDSLSILVLTNLHSMISKLFIMELSGYHNDTYNRYDYLHITMASDEYKPIHFLYQILIALTLLIYIINIIFPSYSVQTEFTMSIVEMWQSDIITIMLFIIIIIAILCSA